MAKEKMDFQTVLELYDLLNDKNLYLLMKILDKDCPHEYGLKNYCSSSGNDTCIDCWKESLGEKLSQGSEIDDNL